MFTLIQVSITAIFAVAGIVFIARALGDMLASLGKLPGVGRFIDRVLESPTARKVLIIAISLVDIAGSILLFILVPAYFGVVAGGLVGGIAGLVLSKRLAEVRRELRREES